MTKKLLAPLATLGLLLTVLLGLNGQDKTAKVKPIKALLVAGGCCHDYKGQHEALYKGIQARANVQVDVFWTDDKSVNPPLPLYDNPNWAEGYDVIIHDECAAGNRDLKVLKNILDAHKTVPAVHLHCAMHSFRVSNNDAWFKHLGIKSTRHGPHKPIDVVYVDKSHPISKPLEDWTTGNEELYNNLEVYDGIQPLALGKQMVNNKEDVAIVTWVNETQGAPSFSTTLGHHTATVQDDRYLNLITRGVLWSTGKLNEQYLGVPYKGENKITFVPAKPKTKPAPQKTPSLKEAPKGATLIKTTASSEESNKSNFSWRAIDGNTSTRWCAANAGKPAWLQLELDKPHDLTGIHISWESKNNAYQRKLEVSQDGKTWVLAFDGTSDTTKGNTDDEFTAKQIQFVRITCTGTSAGGWASIREIKLHSPTIKSLYPKFADAQKNQATKLQQAENLPYAKQGNIPAEIVKLTPQEEQDILKQVKVPEGFDVSVFSSWQAANYPVYVAAAPNGDLYVASDGNGSLGRDPKRGRVLRLRDNDKDGRADEVKAFIPDIDSPRGLIWDHDRLYVLHPPHISVYHDKDRDGIAESSKKLIDGIAFGFKDRPADHTTNGIDIGIDGWIYIAGGDFGFMKATGSDGRTLQHRGGGVIRFRPDGSGLELFATGTRNILGTPISPLLDIFARDNTNDGGGWDVRFHHFTGLEDHGYPRMYKNFADEHVHPLADYGGGSGCGSMYLSEPGFPEEWNHAPLTCDWGSGALWKHSVKRNGGAFEETAKPEKLIALPRPTDADVDGLSQIYQASWKGKATFRWDGPETGYIVKVSPSNYTPEPLPDFDKLAEVDLIALIGTTTSQVRRIAAQRSLMRRELSSETIKIVLKNNESNYSLEGRIGLLYTLAMSQADGVARDLMEIATSSSDLLPFIARAMGDLQITDNEKSTAIEFLNSQIASNNPRTSLEAMVSAARLTLLECAETITTRLDSSDQRIGHTAFQALARLQAHSASFEALDKGSHRAAFALMRMHSPEVVDQSISRLESTQDKAIRQRLLNILCRLYHQEAEWKGNSWGTRPDTRGPYYELKTWEQSDKIFVYLKSLLENAPAEEAAFLVEEMNRNRIQSDDALNKIISLAAKDSSLIPTAVTQIARADSVPADGLDLLISAANNSKSSPATHSQAIQALAKTDHPKALTSMLAALGSLDNAKGFGKDQSAGRSAFLKAPKLENYHLAIEQLAKQEFGSAQNRWANAALLTLAERKSGSPESRELSQKAIDTAWKNKDHKMALMKVLSDRLLKTAYLNNRIVVAVNDPDADIAKVAKSAAQRLRLQLPGEDKTPKIATFAKPADAIAAVTKLKADAALGESVFTRANCQACHTVTQDEKQKGPYLGTIAQTYNRQQLVEAIIDPGKTIAQGFKTNIISTKDGTTVAGFVTDEAGETVTVRDIASNEYQLKKSDITKRDTSPVSMMPPGLVNQFTVKEVASLVDYLVDLAK